MAVGSDVPVGHPQSQALDPGWSLPRRLQRTGRGNANFHHGRWTHYRWHLERDVMRALGWYGVARARSPRSAPWPSPLILRFWISRRRCYLPRKTWRFVIAWLAALRACRRWIDELAHSETAAVLPRARDHPPERAAPS